MGRCSPPPWRVTMAKYDRRPGNRDKLRPVTPPDAIYDRTSLEFSLESRNIPFLYPLSGLRPRGIYRLRLCAAKSLFWTGRGSFLSLSPRCNYSGAGEEIGEIPQQGCALSRSFFARIIPEGEGERFSGRVNMVRVNEPCDLSPLFWITFAWILLR